MTRFKNHTTLLRLLYRLLLFVVIIQQNYGNPLATSVPTILPPFDMEISSPVPFTTRKPEISFAAINEKNIELLETPFMGGSSATSTPKDIEASLNKFVQQINNNNNNYNNDNYDINKNSYDDYIETDIIKVEKTTPTSMEQQDDPVIPPTTITFSNVAAAGILGNSNSNIDGVVMGNGERGNDASVSVVNFNDVAPPYAAVDDKYVPSKPQNLTVLDVTATSITMSWHPPKNQNGAIAGYHVFHIHDNQTGVEIVKRNAADSAITFELPKLKPFTEYRIKVNAFTTKNEGESSDKIIQRTDVAGPSAPIIVNLTCHSQDSLTIRWKRPLEFYNNIDFYIIKTKIVGQDTHRDIRINASAKELETAMIIQNLTMYQLYEVKVAAATFSIINPKKIILGKFSEGRKIGLQPNCEKIQPLLRQSHNDYNLAVLVGIIFSCFGIVLIVMAFFLWRTNVNKINGKQKELMAQFMADHQNLAKNLLPNCGQGKTTAKRLWEELSNKLNSYGPPVKNASVWRKVYADQKHNAKKKLSFNKASKRNTGGGPYEEMILSPAEEQIIQAAGIEAAVEGIPSIKTFGSSTNTKETVNNIEDSLNTLLDDTIMESEDLKKETPILLQQQKQKQQNCKADTKLSLLMSNISKTEKYYSDLNAKLDHLINLKERSLKLKEEEHAANMAIKNIDLQMKTIELRMLTKRQC